MVDCARCGASVRSGQEYSLLGGRKNSPVAAICPLCAMAVESDLKAETENPNLSIALLFGLGAALVCSVLWYLLVVVTHYQLGIAAVAVGWLVSQAVMRGAGGKRGRSVQALSVAVVLLAMAFSEYLIVQHYLAEALAQRGVTDVPYLLPLDTMPELVASSIADDPIALLFWGIAVYEAIVIPAARRLRLEAPTGIASA